MVVDAILHQQRPFGALAGGLVVHCYCEVGHCEGVCVAGEEGGVEGVEGGEGGEGVEGGEEEGEGEGEGGGEHCEDLGEWGLRWRGLGMNDKIGCVEFWLDVGRYFK